MIKKFSLIFLFCFFTSLCFADTQDRYPVGDNDTTGTWNVYPASPTTKWDKVDETPYDSSTTFINCTALGRQVFNFTIFSVPTGATIQNLTLTYVHEKIGGTQSCNIRSGLRVNNVYYETVDTGVNPTQAVWATRQYNYSTNPATSLAWTVNDINRAGSYPLQNFGLNSTDISPVPHCTQVYATVTYTPVSTRRIIITE